MLAAGLFSVWRSVRVAYRPIGLIGGVRRQVQWQECCRVYSLNTSNAIRQCCQKSIDVIATFIIPVRICTLPIPHERMTPASLLLV